MKTYKIGRNPDNDIVIQDDTLIASRYHATLNVSDNGNITIIDNSTNGTFVNGLRLQKNIETTVKNNDEIKFGKSAFLNWNDIKIQTASSFTHIENHETPKKDVQGMFSEAFSFDGRIRRLEYGLSNIIYAVIAIIINYTVENDESLAVIYLGFFPLLWFLFAQGAKRCHDLGNSGWFQLIPFYGLWLLFANGEKGENKYGNNPKGE